MYLWHRRFLLLTRWSPSHQVMNFNFKPMIRQNDNKPHITWHRRVHYEQDVGSRMLRLSRRTTLLTEQQMH